MTDPWSSDSGNFTPTSSNAKIIYQNHRIKKYLQIGQHENNFFLVGRKGLGKSLLLRYKSFLYRDNHENYKFIPATGLTENASIRYNTFSKEHLLTFQKLPLWEDIWAFILRYVVCLAANIEINEEIKKHVKYRTSISALLTEMLNNRGSIHKYTQWIAELTDNISQIQSGVAVFIDNVDQEFERVLIEDEHFTDNMEYEHDINPSVKLWTNVQLGLMLSIYRINRFNAHIKIFTTIRGEAFNNLERGIKANLRTYFTELNYEKEEIKEIFFNRIKAMNPSEFTDKVAANWMEKFVGFSEMKHPYAMNGRKEKQTESVFDFLYRHTYGRPREILIFGQAISEMINLPNYQAKSEAEKVKAIRYKINDISYDELFDFYKREIIPKFNEAQFKEFVQTMHKNIVQETEIELVDPQTMKFYYNLGLIGHIKVVADSKYKYYQNFLPTSKYNYRNLLELPRSKYYFTHPSIDQALIEINGGTGDTFYSRFNIIGHENPFFEPAEKNYIHKPIEFYFPKVAGERWRTNGETSGHILPLESYFRHFFSSKETYIENLRNNYHQDADGTLNIIGNIVISNILKKQSSRYEKHFDKFSEELTTNGRIKQGYQKLMKELNRESMEVFSSKLYGRLVFMGTYLFFNFSCKNIHSCFLKGELDFSTDFFNNSPFRYIQKSFFLNGLINDSRMEKEKLASKQKIFESASDFEKSKLKDWVNDFKENLSDCDWIDKNHLSYLRKAIFPTHWAPNKNEN